MSNRRTPPLVPLKTPLSPKSERKMKRLQQEIDKARAAVNATREGANSESTHIIELINGIGFVEVDMADGAPAATRFIAGVKHPETGLDYYVILDRDAAKAVQNSPRAGDSWRGDLDATGSVTVRTQRTADTSTAARVMYQLMNPHVRLRGCDKVVVKEDADGNRNPLDLRMSNLEVKLSPFAGQLTTVPDLSDFTDRIAAIVASTADEDDDGE